ncbi:hypothetical protein HDU93_000841 [Gonapodya sp. JEL0774]|nr:hypothetical protein HDU93_000841 [Gonapodya sp. JEL0774]
MPKTVLVLGGTGLTGRLIIDTFLAKGHTVVAYSRNVSKYPSELTSTYPQTFVPVQGSIDNVEELKSAMTVRPVSIVVSCMGPVDVIGHKVGSISSNYKTAIASAMNSAGVKRIYALSTISYLDPADSFSLSRNLLVGLVTLLTPTGKAEMIEIAKVFNETDAYSNVDWTVFRVGILTNAAPTKVVAGPIGAPGSSSSITRSSIAQWLLEQVESGSTEWVKKNPYISN